MARDGRDGIDGKTGQRGPRGGEGPPGERGASAYELACLRGFVGTEREWLLSLKAEQGEPGLDGKQGEVGPPGPRGPIGPMPRHEWDGPLLRFQQTPTQWGEWMNLQGPPGERGSPGGGGGGSSGGNVDVDAIIEQLMDTMNSYDPIGF